MLDRRTLAAAALALAAPWAAQAQDANLARNLAATCANCHGTNGNVRGRTSSRWPACRPTRSSR